jgi:UTP--glucose-1-phosphate uridylyltransferase
MFHRVTDASKAAVVAMAGYVFADGRYDIGKKLDYLRATVELGIDHPEIGAEFSEFLCRFMKDRGLA